MVRLRTTERTVRAISHFLARCQKLPEKIEVTPQYQFEIELYIFTPDTLITGEGRLEKLRKQSEEGSQLLDRVSSIESQQKQMIFVLLRLTYEGEREEPKNNRSFWHLLDRIDGKANDCPNDNTISDRSPQYTRR